MGFDISKLFDTRTTKVGDYSGAKEYVTPGLIHEFWDKLTGQNQNLISPLAGGYTPPATTNPYNQTVQTPQEQYTQPAEQLDFQTVPKTTPNKYEYFDKPSIPTDYAGMLDTVPNSEIVGSVLAQETGGYGYGMLDPQTGKTITDWNEIKRRGMRGAAGEVGLAQIIPKYYWKEAGFPDEESYAQRLYDPYFSIEEAARITAKNIAISGGDIKKALGRWNKAPSYPDEILTRIGKGDQGGGEQ